VPEVSGVGTGTLPHLRVDTEVVYVLKDNELNKDWLIAAVGWAVVAIINVVDHNAAATVASACCTFLCCLLSKA
jgi:hypothetical protein